MAANDRLAGGGASTRIGLSSFMGREFPKCYGLSGAIEPDVLT
jgi:hypothetical protein